MIIRKELSSVNAENRCVAPDNSEYEFSYLDFDRTVHTNPVDSFHRVHEIPHVADNGCGF
jgi:hypothetical protein